MHDFGQLEFRFGNFQFIVSGTRCPLFLSPVTIVSSTSVVSESSTRCFRYLQSSAGDLAGNAQQKLLEVKDCMKFVGFSQDVS